MSDAKQDPPAPDISLVQLDGLVVLKIIKHCGDNVPDSVTGQLLGLDVGGRLDITDVFPFPTLDADEDSDAYQLAMMKCLRTVNVDINAVGWYQSSFLASFLTQNLVEAQYNYQKAIPTSVLLVYDPLRTTAGHLHLKAYRLTDAFMRTYPQQQQQPAKGDRKTKFDFTSSDILQKLPIKVHNSHLVHAFLYELREDKARPASCDWDRLHMDAGGYLEKNIDALSHCIDEHTAEQGKFQYHQRLVQRQKQQQAEYQRKRDAENDERKRHGKEPLADEDTSKLQVFKPIPKPSRLDTFLISGQISHYCKEIGAASTEAMNKMYLIEALHKSAAAVV